MSLWKRFVRAIKSIFGGFVATMEDPKLILEQNIRELNDQIPKMNENIATVKANVVLLQKEVKRYEKELANLSSKIKAAIQANRDDLARQYALRLEHTREALERSREQLKYASAAYDKALQIKKAFLREKERKIQEAREALRAYERAQWQKKVADALEQFEVGGIDQTHDEMVRKIQEEAARNEARIEMALDSADVVGSELEEEAEHMRADEIVRQFKAEMGLLSPSPDTSEKEKPAEETEKTLGRQRSSGGST